MGSDTTAPTLENFDVHKATFRQLREVYDDSRDGEDFRLADAARQEMARRESCWRDVIYARGERYRPCRLSNFETPTERHKQALKQSVDFCRNMSDHEGGGIAFVGPVGTGKDHLMISVLGACVMDHGMSARWVNGLDFYGEFRDAMSRNDAESDVIREFLKPDILAISDPVPPAGTLTEYQAQQLFRVIDDRYSRMKRVFLTVNAVDRKDLESKIGVAVTDRLLADAVVVKCNWESHRRPEADRA